MYRFRDIRKKLTSEQVHELTGPQVNKVYAYTQQRIQLVHLSTCKLVHFLSHLLPHLLALNNHNLIVEILIVCNLYTRKCIGLSWLFVVDREVVNACCSL